jgi:hypothetical protein
VNPRLAQLFMICSNIKLTGPAESIAIDALAIHEWNQRDLSMDVQLKLEILADAAKYDASCASSGTEKRDSSDGKGLGSTAPGMGICHSYAPDGRCISLLKVLLTNACNYDCLYCVNRTSSNVARARFTVDEVVKLTIDFYRRNYIEGLFLSSGIIRSADYTMEQVVSVARKLREEHHFRGYGQRHALARHRSETGLGAAASRALSARCFDRQPRGSIARAGLRHQGGGPHHRYAPPELDPFGRSGAAAHPAEEGAAVHHAQRPPAIAASARWRGAKGAVQAEGDAIGIWVLGVDVILRCEHLRASKDDRNAAHPSRRRLRGSSG